MKAIIYTATAAVFLISFIGMLIYGYKTFYIESDTTTSKEYKYHFALIAEETENDYWRLIEKGARKAAAENDIYLEYVAPKKADNEALLELLDRMISANVDGIIVQGVEGQRFVDLAHKGNERHLPIITIDADVKGSERQAYIGTDNFHAGELAGQTMIENTTGEQYVGIVTGRLDALSQQERIAGFKDKIKSHPRIHLTTTEESGITVIGAAQATYSLLKEYPEITALIGTSALDGMGMVEGLHEIAPNKEVYMTAFDTLPETLQLIQENKIDATIAQYPEKMGYKAVEVMIGLQEKGLLEREVFTETNIIEKQDLQRSGGELQ
ncbi:ribose transport system substrate-binding protein [Virgibacillus halotolerans]|uniref:substrate-binding domain-containing protein n=1 Tax=Virgibacillus halotolerans TaxID=1071053 RepID=UPI001960CB69|nr:substrate-binding domain-containing protein [Virgibacillus halotolerans]MBM7599959.1 ribose transport system substrate-binding protein [Virgibacillus halotolerans]